MLVITRKRNEVIYIGDIKITVCSVKGGQVRLGIDAPKEIPIIRDVPHIPEKVK